MAPRNNFDTELENLNVDLIHMGSLVEQAITESIEALCSNDKQAALEIIAQDREIDELEKAIEARCLRLLMRQQPVARDLRAISTALKMITDLERIGDQAADIAELSSHFVHDDSLSIAAHIPEMGKIAVEMVKACIDAFVHNDLELAASTIQRDDEVDDLFNVVKNELIKTIQTEPDKADLAINLLMVAKYLERIGDHAVNVCEWVTFYATGLHKKTRIL